MLAGGLAEGREGLGGGGDAPVTGAVPRTNFSLNQAAAVRTTRSVTRASFGNNSSCGN